MVPLERVGRMVRTPEPNKYEQYETKQKEQRAQKERRERYDDERTP